MDPQTVDQNYAQLQQQGPLGGGFGRAIVSGAGFGIGDDIINKIF